MVSRHREGQLKLEGQGAGGLPRLSEQDPTTLRQAAGLLVATLISDHQQVHYGWAALKAIHRGWIWITRVHGQAETEL